MGCDNIFEKMLRKFAALRFTTQENTVRKGLSTNAGDFTETILDLSKNTILQC
jgi:hypothetical protein